MLTRGIRNNNPFNIRHSRSNKWQGMSSHQTDKSFVQFVSMSYGLRAGMVLLINYRRKYRLKTLSQVISRFAPATENDVDSYIASVIRLSGGHFTTPVQEIDSLCDFLLLCYCMLIVESDYYTDILSLYNIYCGLDKRYRIYVSDSLFTDDDF